MNKKTSSIKNNNTDLSIGTESHYSNSSDNLQNNAVNNDNKGLMSLLYGDDRSNILTNLCLDAFRDRKLDVVHYIFAKESSLNYSLKDESGKTILHYLVIYSVYDPVIKQHLINCINEYKDNKQRCNNFLNIQDNLKNTAAHYALYLGLDDVVKMLEDSGADLTLKNDKGYSISSISVPIKNKNSQQNVFPISQMSDAQPELSQTSDIEDTSPYNVNNLSNDMYNNVPNDVSNDIFVKSSNQQYDLQNDDFKLQDYLKKIVEQFYINNNPTTDLESIGFNPNELTATAINDEEENVDYMQEKLSNNEKNNERNTDNNFSLNSDDFFNRVVKNYKKSNKMENPEDVKNMDNLIFEQTGGKSKNKFNNIVGGRRQMITYSELSIGSKSNESKSNESKSNESGYSDDNTDTDNNLDNMDRKEITKIAREFNEKSNDASQAHERALQRIAEILKLEKNDIIVKAVKAILYNKVKSEKPTESNYEKAIELENMAADADLIKNIKRNEIDKMVKIIEEKQNNKSNLQNSATSESSATSASSATSQASDTNTDNNTNTDTDSNSNRNRRKKKGGKYNSESSNNDNDDDDIIIN
jgi:hypothetical protein